MLFSGTRPRTAWVIGSTDGKPFITIGNTTLYNPNTGIWVKDSQGHISMGYLAENVVDPSYHGIHITSTPGGEIYDWASVDAGFDPSDIVEFGLDNGDIFTKTPLTPEVTTISNIPTGSVVIPGSYFNLSSPSAQYYVWYKVDGVGIIPSPGGFETLYSWVFEGVDEAITWTEPDGPDPSFLGGAVIDIAQHYAGSSSLLLSVDGEADWNLPSALLSDFKVLSYFRFHAVDGYVSIMNMNDNDGYASIGLELSYSDGNVHIYIEGRDSADNYVGDVYSEIIALTADTWHKCEVTISDRNISVKINDTELVFWVAAIDNPLAGLDSFYVNNQNYTEGNDVWIDNIAIRQPSSRTLFLGGTGIQVDLLSTDTATEVAVKIAAALDEIDGGAVFDVPVPIIPTIVVTNVIAGSAVDPASDESSEFTIDPERGTETLSYVVSCDEGILVNDLSRILTLAQLIPDAGLWSDDDATPLSSVLTTKVCLIDADVTSDCTGVVDSAMSAGIDLGSTKLVNKLILRLLSSEITFPTVWGAKDSIVVYSSPDNSTWTLEQTFDAPTLVADDDYIGHVELILTTPVSTRYFKIYASDGGLE